MTIRYFCDRCDRERRIYTFKVACFGKVIELSICEECIWEFEKLFGTYLGKPIVFRDQEKGEI